MPRQGRTERVPFLEEGFPFLERGAKCLHFLMLSVRVLTNATEEGHTLVPVGVLALHVILSALDGIVGVLERKHSVEVHEVGEVLIGFCPRCFVFSDL